MVTHPIRLRGAGVLDEERAVLIVERTDDDFLKAMLEELAAEKGLEHLEDEVVATQITYVPTSGLSNLRKLYQPVQRTFNIALYEAYCQGYEPIAWPRVDPDKIDSAGLVVRRCKVDDLGAIMPGVWEGWRQNRRPAKWDAAGRAWKDLRGWVRFAPGDEDLDPDPALRPRTSLGLPELDRVLAQSLDPTREFSEDAAPLFVAPPEVGEATGKTLLYNVIPVTSSEMSAVPPDLLPYSDDFIAGHIPLYFQAGVTVVVPHAGNPLSYNDVTTSAQKATDDPTKDTGLDKFMLFLRQVAVEFDAFGTTAEATSLYAELNKIQLTMSMSYAQVGSGLLGGTSIQVPVAINTRPAGEFLHEATQVLAMPDDPNSTATVTMPQSWPQLSQDQADRLKTLIGASLRAGLKAITPAEGRYDDASRPYQMRAFIRVKRDDGCPPDLVWSDYSEPFLIAAWYEHNQAVPPVKIQLPDASDRNLLKSLKPNVSFVLPKNLFDLLNTDPRDLMKGKGSRGDGSGGGIVVDWICSFSIPIITLCAFIVFNIFFTLFDLIFQWMLLLKICIPFPHRKPPQ